MGRPLVGLLHQAIRAELPSVFTPHCRSSRADAAFMRWASAYQVALQDSPSAQPTCGRALTRNKRARQQIVHFP